MFHQFGTITNTKGDSLVGWQVECVQLADGSTVIDIYADENSTAISSVSGISNRAVSDDEGNYDFFVTEGDYSLRFYNAAGEFQKTQRYVPMYGRTAGAVELRADLADTTAGKGAGLVVFEDGNTVQDLASTTSGKGASLVTMEDGTDLQAKLEAVDTAVAAKAATADLASTTSGKGAALVGKEGGGTVQDFIESGSISSFGSFGDLTPAATALTTVDAALADVGAGGILASLEDASIGAATTDNPGAEIIGEKGVYFEGASGGRRLINKPGRDTSLYQFGRENLVRWLEGLRAAETLKVALVGDSNTASYVGATLATYLDSLPNVSLTNFGVSGTQIEQWRTAAAPYDANGKSLADVVTYDPDLIVMCWGTNDPVVGARTAANVATSFDAALTTLRASLDTNTCSIALLTPNAMGDTSDRDELWSLQIRPIIRAMADRFDCGLFDKNALFPNSAIDLAAGAMQNKFFDSARVHTATLATNILAAMIAEWLTPRELWGLTWDNIPTKAAADLSSTYPPGVSIARMSDGSFDGFALTINPISAGGHFPIQINWPYTGTDSRFAWRVALAGTWSSWTTNGADPLQLVGSIASGYAATGGANSLNTRRQGILTSLSGRLNVSPAAQVVSSTVLCNIATTDHRPIFNIQDAEVVALNAGGTVERLRADVLTNGNVVVRATSTMTDATSVSLNLTFRGV